MGIKGLHKGLAFCTKKGNISDYRGKSVAVDASSWLHKSVYSCSEIYVESLERRQVDSHSVRVSSNYIINRCKELLNCFHLSRIYLTMDGKRCPLKANESREREERRRRSHSSTVVDKHPVSNSCARLTRRSVAQPSWT